MAYTDLTEAQKKAIQDVLTGYIRPAAGMQQDLVRLYEQVNVLYNTTSDFRAAMDLLLSSDSIPNDSGLAGASAILKSDLTHLTAGMFKQYTDMVTLWRGAALLTLCVKLGGINAE